MSPEIPEPIGLVPNLKNGYLQCSRIEVKGAGQHEVPLAPADKGILVAVSTMRRVHSSSDPIGRPLGGAGRGLSGLPGKGDLRKETRAERHFPVVLGPVGCLSPQCFLDGGHTTVWDLCSSQCIPITRCVACKARGRNEQACVLRRFVTTRASRTSNTM